MRPADCTVKVVETPPSVTELTLVKPEPVIRMLAPVAPIVRSAHERVDGGGYPDGLRGEEIPRGAMIIATCDAFHAMTSNRTYRRAMAHDEAIRELEANAGTQFDPAVVGALVAELSKH